MNIDSRAFTSIAIGRIERPGFDNRLVTSAENFDYAMDAPTYTSEPRAFAEAARLSAGDAPAAAVFAAGENNWAVVPVDMLTLGDKLTASSRPYDGVGSHREQAIVFSRSDVLGIVDANVVIRNTGAGEPSPVA